MGRIKAHQVKAARSRRGEKGEGACLNEGTKGERDGFKVYLREP